jgi:hypothetical protein
MFGYHLVRTSKYRYHILEGQIKDILDGFDLFNNNEPKD